MKHKYIIFKLFIIFASLANCSYAQSKNQFLRINEEKRTVELAFKTYERASDNKKVILISMFHFSDADFYKKAADEIKDLVVLYESLNFTIEDKKIIKKRIKNLGSYFKKIQKSPELSSMVMSSDWQDAKALSLGLVSQEEGMSYKKALKNIHADEYNREQVEDFLSLNDSDFEEAINQGLPFWSKLCTDKCEKALSYGYMLYKLYNYYMGEKERIFRQAVEDHLDPNEDSNFDKRNEIVKQKLHELIHASTWNNVAIVYGAMHMPVFAKFLEETGFKLIDTRWVDLTSLDLS